MICLSIVSTQVTISRWKPRGGMKRDFGISDLAKEPGDQFARRTTAPPGRHGLFPIRKTVATGWSGAVAQASACGV